MLAPGRPLTMGGLETPARIGSLRPSEERQAEIAMYRVLLTSMKKRHDWDRFKCALATGIPIFWVAMILLRPHVPGGLAGSLPTWIAAGVQPLFEEIPALWMIVISLAIAGFQWYNLVHFQRRVIPLVRGMYERALARRDPQLITMLGEALRSGAWLESLRNVFRSLVSMSR